MVKRSQTFFTAVVLLSLVWSAHTVLAGEPPPCDCYNFWVDLVECDDAYDVCKSEASADYEDCLEEATSPGEEDLCYEWWYTEEMGCQTTQDHCYYVAGAYGACGNYCGW